MADWLKVNHSLVRSAKIRALMRELRCKKHAALGLAVSWLVWIDEQTTDGQTGLLPDELDDEIGFRGCTDALISIGWAALGEDGCVCALEFGKHCGESAKERAENARRVAKCKAKKRKVMADCYQGNEKTLPDALPEKNRIESNNMGDGLSGALSAPNAEPAPPALSDDEEGFRVWLAAVCAAHPSARRSRVLAADVLAAAREAWMRCPEAAEHAELLGAYFASKLQEDRRGVKFYRPTGQRKFFEHLEDVLAAALDRWARDARWVPQQGQAVQRVVSIRKADGKPATEAEKEEFMDFLRDGGKGEK